MNKDRIDTKETFVQDTVRELTVTELEQVTGGNFVVAGNVGNFNFASFNGLANTGIINKSFNEDWGLANTGVINKSFNVL
jgi:hypothetical protein